ncbi:MAG: D-glycero-beta-D-manno-heptose 1-phosphate adenylyltransferase [Planctomycetaceae bacterium]|nr:D-glycero-beta-D-manno-heptose 1-phosphate adenylyltransferase [Planctomycetaceae bacterium]
MTAELIEHLQNLGSPRVLVLGDLILDRYIFGDAERVSQEAPVILLRADKEEIRLGGAANVANLLRGLEAEVTLAGVVGRDSDGIVLRHELERFEIGTAGILEDEGRPTTVKERYIGRAQQRHQHQMLRVDREVRTAVDGLIAERLQRTLEELIPQHDVVLVSDYAKGVCTPTIVQAAILSAREHGIPVMVDPQPGADYGLYKGATGVTPNRLETYRATGIQVRTPEDAFAAGEQLCRELELDFAFITLDSDGMALVERSGRTELLPTRRREVYDITGAGDMVLAMIGVGLAAGINPADLGRLANIAGGLEVEQIGVVRITREEMLADLIQHHRGGFNKSCTRESLALQVAARRRTGQRIVLTNGCFDLLHVGHVTYLQEAAREGDCLIVAINSDASVRRLNKGPDRPLFSEVDRAKMLAALECVDLVTVFDEETPHALLEAIRPDVLVKGGTYTREEIVGWEVVEGYGGTVKPLTLVSGISTTRIVTALRTGDQVPTSVEGQNPEGGVGTVRMPASSPEQPTGTTSIPTSSRERKAG